MKKRKTAQRCLTVKYCEDCRFPMAYYRQTKKCDICGGRLVNIQQPFAAA
jgi:hypothetical protein